MKAKSRQISAKNFTLVISMLRELVGVVERLSLPKCIRDNIERLLGAIIGILLGTDTLADPENSDKPSGKDIKPAKKPEKKSNGKQGGQPGHKGHTLLQSENPNRTVFLTPGRDELLESGEYDVTTETRQVRDIEVKLVITNYVLETFKHKETGEVIRGEFPPGVNAPVQYGPEVKYLAVLLAVVNNIPFERAAAVLQAIAGGLAIAASTVFNMRGEKAASPVLRLFEKAAVSSMITGPRCNADETGIKLGKALHWIHLADQPCLRPLLQAQKKGKRGDGRYRDSGPVAELSRS